MLLFFGVGKTAPGLLIFRDRQARNMTSQEYIEHIWPAVEDANSSAEGFSQISKDMIVVLGDNRDPPCTDKGSIIRSRTYVEFADEIENAYQKLGDSVEGSLRFDEIQLQ